MRRGPPAPGIHRARIFALFLLPGGRPRCFTPELDSAAAEEAEGSMGLGSVEEEVALEEEGEVSEVSRRPYVTPHLLPRWNTYVNVLLPGSLDSTTVQNIVIIAHSVIYYITNPDTIVFKPYRNSLAIWTCLNTRV
jgi:hypothetical protein